ncbi:Short-chain dehydrogenase [Frankia sp. AiPs1]|uniref:SDR family NAD(P)-dependent oxidoreductase n=1 Tax=Frankia sp. AiPa1 TaxID=573492 RepID=UPI00202AD8B8|nr:SDR family NAD(P)-dependent oxidoreductase [Frankia sp. AiPa1]MCL9760043.1 SDR family oxidoreductase [Frankia sp. AiPa1]
MSDQPRVVVLLGAGGALGSALARRFAAEAGTAVVLGDVSEAALAATVESINDGVAVGGAAVGGAAVGGTAGGGGAVGGVAVDGAQVATALVDVSEREQVEAVVRLAVERFGRLDVLISNAGVLAPNGRIHNLATADWDRSYRINVLGAVNAVHAAVGPMRQGGGGSIVLTASVAGLTAWSHAAPYCVTKAAVIHLAKVAAVEYARDRIRVNAVCPGTFLSAMHETLPATAVEAIAAKHPLGLGTPGDLVGAYAYLASDAARWTTGSALVVDGGYAAP